jgi:hypothetical protein
MRPLHTPFATGTCGPAQQELAMNVLYKRLVELTAEDIRWLVDNKVQEGADLEFKGALSTKDGTDDRWLTHGDGVGENAKSDLVRELVGFANAQGGALVLGVADDKGKPARASTICPVPRVELLADRLKMACRDWIEPKLHSLEVRGLPLQDDGSGVVVLRVNGGSTFGPHRHRGNKECYIRRNDETLPMDMVEIQRRSVELERRLSRIDDDFAKQRDEFFNAFYPLLAAPRVAVQIRATPLTSLSIPNLHRVAAAKPAPTRFGVSFPKGGQAEAVPPIRGVINWRPVIRGTAAEESREDERWYVSAHDDGRLLFRWASHRGEQVPGQRRTQVFLGWLAGFFGSALLAIERVRRAAAAPSSEFALELCYAASASFSLADYHDQYVHDRKTIPSGNHIFPRYAVGSVEQFSSLMQVFETDVLNLAGSDLPGEEATYDFAPALSEIGKGFDARS